MHRILLLVTLCLLATNWSAAADRPLVFDQAQSTVDIVVKATVDSFIGRLSVYRLSGVVDEQGGITSARLDFRFADVLTGKAKRDAAMHEWQHTREFPDASFELLALHAENGITRASGRLTLHGVTRDLSFPVTIARDGAVYAIDGDAPIDTREFGLPVIRMMGLLKVDPLVRVKFHFQGRAT